MAYPRVGRMENSVQWNDGDMVDQLAAQGFAFHSQGNCNRDDACVIHNKSDHHMNEWPRNVRSSALVERICRHGVGHPDPDSIAFFESIGRLRGLDQHGCDGCCAEPVVEPRPTEMWKVTTVVVEADARRTEVSTDADGWVRIKGDSIRPVDLSNALVLLTEK